MKASDYGLQYDSEGNPYLFRILAGNKKGTPYKQGWYLRGVPREFGDVWYRRRSGVTNDNERTLSTTTGNYVSTWIRVPDKDQETLNSIFQQKKEAKQ